MNIGLLLCDHVDDELVPTHGDYPEMFSNLLRPVIPTLKLKCFDSTQGILPAAVDTCNAYIISGSRFGVQDPWPWIDSLESFILDLWVSKQKLIGVCFGHQLIAKALGGIVQTSPKGWGIGLSENHLLHQPSWMHPTHTSFHLLNSHRDQIVALPKQAQVLARNPHCPYYMLQFDNRFLTIQGHPEFTNHYLEDLLKKRQSIYEPDCYAKGMLSLIQQSDSNVFAQWMLAFLND